MNQKRNAFVLLLLGPLLLLAALLLLFFQTSYLTLPPVWLLSFAISIALTCWINFMAVKECCFHEEKRQTENTVEEEKIQDLRGVLDETHLLYRDKVANLEKQLKNLEEEKINLVSDQEKALKTYEKNHKLVFEESAFYKRQVDALQVSLSDALDELRPARQMEYLQKENSKTIPPDLIHKHVQLREQFDEKAAVLNQTRKELFALEGELLILKNEHAEQKFDSLQEQDLLFSVIKNLEEEKESLKKEISALEQIITVAQKKPSPVKNKKKLEKMLEFQFDHLET